MIARSRAEPDASRRVARRGAVTAPSGPSLMPSGLFADAGNRAVSRRVRALAREDFSDSVEDADKTGITRLVVTNLRFGIGSFRAKYGDEPDDVSFERKKTDLSPSHMAVVLVPDAALKLNQPVQVILHFHGWGFREGDPFAGYMPSGSGHTRVRDVKIEHWEHQIAALVGKGPQVVAILAQGRGKSDFGEDFSSVEYVRDVLEKSGREDLVKLAASEKYSLILSAHSGGGSRRVVPALKAGEAETADPSRVAAKLAPVDLVVLFEALNGDGDVDEVMNWINNQLARLVPALQQDPAKALAATPVLRGYYGNRKSGYRERYRWLACRIQEAIESRVPEKFRPDVSDRFRIIEVTDAAGQDVGHEEVISGTGAKSSGSLADALRAQRNPQIDRAAAVLPDADECATLKAHALERAKEAEERAKARARAKAKAAEATKAAEAAKAQKP